MRITGEGPVYCSGADSAVQAPLTAKLTQESEHVAPIFTIRSASIILVMFSQMRLYLFIRELELSSRAWVVLMSLSEDQKIDQTLYKQKPCSQFADSG